MVVVPNKAATVNFHIRKIRRKYHFEMPPVLLKGVILGVDSKKYAGSNCHFLTLFGVPLEDNFN
jgi:hypothetical protein